MAVFIAQLFLLLQRMMPKRLITAIVHRLARIRVRLIKDFLIRSFVKFYEVNLDEVRKSAPDGFTSFNDFFTRELERGSRPIDSSDLSIVSPADGIISAAGSIKKNAVLQAKGIDYSLEELLATDLDEAQRYYDGSFATIYLAPFNYHRVHAPLAGELVAARFVPGSLFSVNLTTVSFLRGLFTRNERLICHFRTAAGPMVLIFVGALNVGSITTPWTGEIRPRKGNMVENIDLQSSSQAKTVNKGDLLGWFNMGSTIILLLPPGVCDWRSGLESGEALRMGEALGQIVQLKA
ncbi:MAG: phosphatidylserine decarboxylase [Proteobacteria bacterium]|nr:phosphatidylserine decarboxylase [Pseudomonadota bacterium]